MWMIWTNKLLPKALKSCPKSNKSPNLVTLSAISSLCDLKLEEIKAVFPFREMFGAPLCLSA